MKIREQQLRRLIKQEFRVLNEENKLRRKLRKDLVDPLMHRYHTSLSGEEIEDHYLEWDNGRKEWREYGKIVREEGPFERGAFKNQPPAKESQYHTSGEEYHFEYGKLSRKDGPARIQFNRFIHTGSGSPAREESWMIDDKFHRDGDKPAFTSPREKKYYKHGKLHRDGGKPAVVDLVKGEHKYFVNGKQVNVPDYDV